MLLLAVRIPMAWSLQDTPEPDDDLGEEPAPVTLRSALSVQWGAAPLWDDGQAEVAEYDASRIVYGAPRPHTAHLITVYEDLNREFYVKADWPYGQKPVLRALRQTQFFRILTPHGEVGHAVMVFLGRDDLSSPLRLRMSSQDWTGSTWKDFQLWGPRPQLLYNSYWDGEGAGERPLEAGRDVYYEEQLYLLLRGLPFADVLGVVSFRLADNQTTTNARPVTVSDAVLVVSHPDEDVTVPAGTWALEDVWRVTVETQDRRILRYDFTEQEPHTLLRFSHSDGRHLELRSVRRHAYWKSGG